MSEEAEILAAASQRVGSVLHGKYHIDGVLGVGGMATVYAATHRNRKRFAVKMLHPEFSVKRDIRSRFIREGYAANSVEHPGVVAVIDDDVDETGAAFLVMELLTGITVNALYAPGAPVPLREALGIAHQLLDVLEAAHRKSVVHRDIKPANLLLLRDGQLKVLDFGIARLRETDAGLKSTRTGATLGTPAFMAPEQARALPLEVDARTDVWAAGATLFTLLSARFVHSGDNARQMMIHAATEPAPSLGTIVPNLPPCVVELVDRALRFARSERWASAAEMRARVLEAHRELFRADPSASDLCALIERTSLTVQTSPTEPAACTESQERESGERVLRVVQTTTSTPFATRGNAATTPKAPAWPLVLAGALAVLGLGSYWVSGRDSGQPAAGTPSAATAALAVAERAGPVGPGTVSSRAPAAEPAPIAAPPQTAASSTHAAAPAASATITRRASGSVAARKVAPPIRSAVASAGSPEPAPAPRLTDNPLKLELQ
jgi:serine/threonine protein kinase